MYNNFKIFIALSVLLCALGASPMEKAKDLNNNNVYDRITLELSSAPSPGLTVYMDKIFYEIKKFEHSPTAYNDVLFVEGPLLRMDKRKLLAEPDILQEAVRFFNFLALALLAPDKKTSVKLDEYAKGSLRSLNILIEKEKQGEFGKQLGEELRAIRNGVQALLVAAQDPNQSRAKIMGIIQVRANRASNEKKQVAKAFWEKFAVDVVSPIEAQRAVDCLTDTPGSDSPSLLPKEIGKKICEYIPQGDPILILPWKK